MDKNEWWLGLAIVVFIALLAGTCYGIQQKLEYDYVMEELPDLLTTKGEFCWILPNGQLKCRAFSSMKGEIE